MGQHTNDLFTNQDYVGSPASETYRTELIKLQFFDKEGNIIIPTKIKMRANIEGATGYEITTRASTHNIGQTTERANLGGRMVITNGELIIDGITNRETEITEMYYFKLLYLETEEKNYSYFQYR